MSAPVGPGDWVECVSSSDAPDGTAIVAGSLYCIADVGDDGDICEECGAETWVELVGQPITDLVWCTCGFKPVYRPRQSLIDSLKAPPKGAPIQQPETVGGSAGFGPRVAARLVPGET